MAFLTQIRHALLGAGVPRAGVARGCLLVVALALVPLAPLGAQQPAPAPSPKYIPPKECPPPEGFRAVLHLLDNNSPALQMYPLPGMPLPKNMFAVFGQDMIPKCALERTYDDISKFKTEFAELGDVEAGKVLAPTKLLKLGELSYRGLKRYQWCQLLINSKAPDFEYDGSQIPELIAGMESIYALAVESGKKYAVAMGAYLDAFKGVENDAVDAKKRLDEDEKRVKPRPAKEIAKDVATVKDYERRFQENKAVMELVRTVNASFRVIGETHTKQKFTWPGSGDPALTLGPLVKQTDELLKKMEAK